MKQTGIIMSGHHPIDILEGSKTMTRRTYGLERVNKNPDDWALAAVFLDGKARFFNQKTDEDITLKCPYGGVGDRLWVKETWAVNILTNKPIYKADFDDSFEKPQGGWKSSLFMPHWASRITLEITGSEIEKIQEITEEDIIAEGILAMPYPWALPIRKRFVALWDSLNARRGYGWDKNPWVWLIGFRVLEIT